MHLQDKLAVARVALRAGAQFVEVEGLAGVIGDLPAHAMSQ